eukprot:m.14303 g.14303  ORF g.14303 m.14303 type:complete len:119 (-) comp4768_c0_seq2:188-544(-)
MPPKWTSCTATAAAQGVPVAPRLATATAPCEGMTLPRAFGSVVDVGVGAGGDGWWWWSSGFAAGTGCWEQPAETTFSVTMQQPAQRIPRRALHQRQHGQQQQTSQNAGRVKASSARKS